MRVSRNIKGTGFNEKTSGNAEGFILEMQFRDLPYGCLTFTTMSAKQARALQVRRLTGPLTEIDLETM